MSAGMPSSRFSSTSRRSTTPACRSSVRLELLLFDPEHVAVQRRRSALFDPRRNQRTLTAGGRQQLLGHRQRPYGGQDLAVFEPHARGQRPLLIGRGLLRASISRSATATRPDFRYRSSGHCSSMRVWLSVPPGSCCCENESDGFGRSSACDAGTLRYIDLCPRGPKRRLPFERPCDRVIQASVHLRGQYRGRWLPVGAAKVPARARPRWP